MPRCGHVGLEYLGGCEWERELQVCVWVVVGGGGVVLVCSLCRHGVCRLLAGCLIQPPVSPPPCLLCCALVCPSLPRLELQT